MIHTRNATLIHFKQSKLSAEYIIDQQKRGWAFLMFVQSYFHLSSTFHLNQLKNIHLYK